MIAKHMPTHPRRCPSLTTRTATRLKSLLGRFGEGRLVTCRNSADAGTRVVPLGSPPQSGGREVNERGLSALTRGSAKSDNLFIAARFAFGFFCFLLHEKGGTRRACQIPHAKFQHVWIRFWIRRTHPHVACGTKVACREERLPPFSHSPKVTFFSQSGVAIDLCARLAYRSTDFIPHSPTAFSLF